MAVSTNADHEVVEHGGLVADRRCVLNIARRGGGLARRGPLRGVRDPSHREQVDLRVGIGVSGGSRTIRRLKIKNDYYK